MTTSKAKKKSFNPRVDIDLDRYRSRLEGDPSRYPFPASVEEAASFLVGMVPPGLLYSFPLLKKGSKRLLSFDGQLVLEFAKRNGHKVSAKIYSAVASGRLKSLELRELITWANKDPEVKPHLSECAIEQAKSFLRTGEGTSPGVMKALEDAYGSLTGEKGKPTTMHKVLFLEHAESYFTKFPKHRMPDFLRSSRFPRELLCSAKGERRQFLYGEKTFKNWAKNLSYNRNPGAPRIGRHSK